MVDLGRIINVIPDEEFIRDKVPMTKAAVRHLSIIKLELKRESVLFDIGSGTGSVAIEAACMDDSLHVYAVERKKEAVNLIRRNKEKFACDNVTIIEGIAPECLIDLPAATHAFIGGSGGRLREILLHLKDKNPKMRVVINAISIETIAEISHTLSNFKIKNLEIEQISVSRGREIGDYHLMMAENPVLIAAFDLDY